MRKPRRSFIPQFFFFALIVTLLNSCCGISLPVLKYDGRRPPVITTWNSCVIDYCPSECERCTECGSCDTCLGSGVCCECHGCGYSSPCADCSGQGNCSACGGRGYIRSRYTSCGEISCDDCGRRRSSISCTNCVESGTCPGCEGRGYQDVCSLCEGSCRCGDCQGCGHSDSCRGGVISCTSCGERPEVCGCSSLCENTICDDCGSLRCDKCGSSGCNACGTSGCKLCGASSCPLCSDAGCQVCGKGDFPSEYYNPFIPWEKHYHVKIGDVLQISVFDDDDTLIDNVLVAPDGFMYYTFLKGIYADGRTLQELNDELTEKLKMYFVTPVVVVSPQLIITRNYKVLGRVNNPGLFPLTAPIKVRQAIAAAGGVQQENYADKRDDARLYALADLAKSFLARDGRRLNIDFKSILLSASERGNIYLRPGDYLYIYPAANKHVFVLGAVGGPQRIRFDEELTLSQALSEARGWRLNYDAFSGDITHTLVIRGSLRRPCYIMVDFIKILNGDARDVHLMPGDIVYVPNKKFRTGRELVDLAIRTFIFSFNTAAVGYWSNQWFPP